MADCMKLAEKELYTLLLESVGRAVAAGTLPAEPMNTFKIEVPADKSHGDFAANIAMVNAKAFRMPPRKIAEAIFNELQLQGSSFEKAEIAGPGFMNFFLKRQWFSKTVQTVLAEGDDYGKTETGAGKRILVEFVSANPTGPMHVGNARGGALGDSLAEILNWAGYHAEREFYINDAGNQIEKFATSLEVRYLQLFDPSVPMPEDAYQGVDIIEHAEAFRLDTITKEELAGMLYENSDEPYSEELAKAITDEIRRGNRMDTTKKLRDVIEKTLMFLPEKERKDTVKKTCQRVFQALRIDVNNEFEVLYEFMEKLPECIKPGGRAAILTFHSGEDRLVKKALKSGYKAGIYSDYAKDVIRPSAKECAQNGRARSTKMRWAIKK